VRRAVTYVCVCAHVACDLQKFLVTKRRRLADRSFVMASAILLYLVVDDEQVQQQEVHVVGIALPHGVRQDEDDQ
jgi:hypothetical protein